MNSVNTGDGVNTDVGSGLSSVGLVVASSWVVNVSDLI